MDAQLAANVRNNINELYVAHERQRRADAGTPFEDDPLWAAQVILPSRPGDTPIVRLNNEVRFRVKLHNSDEWVDYLSVPKDGPSQIMRIDYYPEEAATRNMSYALIGVSSDQVVWFSLGDPEQKMLMRAAYERAAQHPELEEAWAELLEEHGRVVDIILSSVNAVEPELPVETLMAVALQRSRHLLEAYVPLMAQRNVTAASALIRMQLDSVMRVNACFLVADPLSLWDVMKADRKWSSVKDVVGEPLTDGYLHKKLSERFSWVSDTYQRMSGYVHLSRPHLEAATAGYESFLGMQIVHGGAGSRVTDEQILENAALFMKATAALLKLCEEYVQQHGAG